MPRPRKYRDPVVFLIRLEREITEKMKWIVQENGLDRNTWIDQLIRKELKKFEI